jgi:cell wall-associated NlpC family hydrolase
MFTLTTIGSARRPILAALAVWAATCCPGARAMNAVDNGAEVVVQALALLGVPYRWGGSDPARGLDCSGLVQHVYKNVVALDLPRRSEEMSRLGKRVLRGELRAGDLLFFNTLGYPNSHVAVYVGEGRFVHAPSRRGRVRLDDLDDRYWRDRFNGARRIESSETLQVAERKPSFTHPSNWRIEDFPNGP